jgi:hypothetical protein
MRDTSSSLVDSKSKDTSNNRRVSTRNPGGTANGGRDFEDVSLSEDVKEAEH